MATVRGAGEASELVTRVRAELLQYRERTSRQAAAGVRGCAFRLDCGRVSVVSAASYGYAANEVGP